MSTDLKLTQLGLKIKNLIVLDLSFPDGVFPEFRKAYEKRYIHMSNRKEMALEYAGGLSSFGKIVVVYGGGHKSCDLLDPSLNVKVLKVDQDAVWDYFEDELLAFGPALLLIPEGEGNL